MQQAHFLKKLYNRYYPRSIDNCLKLTGETTDWDKLSNEEKVKLADKYLQEGELLLSKKDTNAIDYFNAASQLNPTSANLWLRQGKAFSTYGTLINQEKALFLATKNFKVAASLTPDSLEINWEWGKTLAFLGNKAQEPQHFQLAKEKYEKAIELSKNSDKHIVHQLYWQCGNLWIDIANHSEEAGDVRLAIQAFRMAFAHQTQISAEFWYDYGNAYLQMGLLVNDNRLYIEAIDYFNKALRTSKDYYEAYSAKAHAYTELYINTMDDRCFKNANTSFKECLKLMPHNTDDLLLWAQLLCESGKLTKDHRKLELSIEKCLEAYNQSKKDPFIIAQWVESLSYLGAYTNSLDLILEAESKIIKITEKHQKNEDLWYAYGICLNAFNTYYNDIDYIDLAIEKFQLGLSINRSNPELWHAMASSHANIGRETEDIDCLNRASKFFLRAIDLKPSCPALTFDYGNHLLKLGEIKENRQILENALYYLEITLNNQKDAVMQHPNWLFAYGCTLDLLGDCCDDENSFYKKALHVFHNILLIDPDYPSLHYHIGLCNSHLGELTYDSKYFKQALTSFNLALRQNEENDLVYLEWGLTLISLAEQESMQQQKNIYLEEAEQKITRSGQLGNQHAYYHLSCLYSLLNRCEESMKLLIQAHKQEVLPSIDELMEDEWLDNVRLTEAFQIFIKQLEINQNMVDGH